MFLIARDDLAAWNAQYGMTGTGLAADFNGDNRVDGLDFMVWQTGQGLGVGMSGDANGDAWVDGLDFLTWQVHSGLKSAWHENWQMGAVALTAGSLPDSAPRVANVIVGGSSSTHDAFYFDTVDGSGNQLRTVPVGAADTIYIAFTENVNVSPDSLKVIGLTNANLPTLAEFVYDSNTFIARWRFEDWTLYGDNYLLSLADVVSDIQGNRLDGEWTNPASISTVNTAVSEFPSGDGTPGGVFNFVISLLPGDANLDAIVNTQDADIMWEYFNVPPHEYTVIYGDFSGDGYILYDDEQLWILNEGTNLQDLGILADLDGDFDVDNSDIQTIIDNQGMTNPTYADGDVNEDGVIDQLDLDLAFAQFGIEIDLVA